MILQTIICSYLFWTLKSEWVEISQQHYRKPIISLSERRHLTESLSTEVPQVKTSVKSNRIYLNDQRVDVVEKVTKKTSELKQSPQRNRIYIIHNDESEEAEEKIGLKQSDNNVLYRNQSLYKNWSKGNVYKVINPVIAKVEHVKKPDNPTIIHNNAADLEYLKIINTDKANIAEELTLTQNNKIEHNTSKESSNNLPNKDILNISDKFIDNTLNMTSLTNNSTGHRPRYNNNKDITEIVKHNDENYSYHSLLYTNNGTITKTSPSLNDDKNTKIINRNMELTSENDQLTGLQDKKYKETTAHTTQEADKVNSYVSNKTNESKEDNTRKHNMIYPDTYKTLNLEPQSSLESEHENIKEKYTENKAHRNFGYNRIYIHETNKPTGVSTNEITTTTSTTKALDTARKETKIKVFESSPLNKPQNPGFVTKQYFQSDDKVNQMFKDVEMTTDINFGDSNMSKENYHISTAPYTTKSIKQNTNTKNNNKDSTDEHVASSDGTEDKKENPIENVVKLMKIVSDTISKNTKRSLSSKVRYLEHLKDSILMNIEQRIDAAWGDRASRRRRRRAARGHVEFPSAEGALMSLSFLTFAVFLIKLVLQVIHTYKNNSITTPAVFAVSRAAAALAQHVLR